MKKLLGIILFLNLIPLSSLAMEEQEGLRINFKEHEGDETEGVIIVPKVAVPIFRTLENLRADISEETEEDIGIPLRIVASRSTMKNLIKLALDSVNKNLTSSELVQQLFPKTLRWPEDQELLKKYVRELEVAYYLDAPVIVEAYCQGLANIIKEQETVMERYKIAEFIENTLSNTDIAVAIADQFNVSECLQELSSPSAQTLKESEGIVRALAFSPKDTFFLAAINKIIYIWERDSKEKWTLNKKFLQPGFVVNAVVFSPKGKMFALGGWSKTVGIWKQNPNGFWELEQELNEYDEPIKSLAFSPDGNLLASANWDGTTRIWKQEAHGNWQLFQEIKENKPINSVIFSSDGKLLAWGGQSKIIHIWKQNAEGKWQAFQKLEGKAVITSLAFSPDGNLLASTEWDGTMRIWKPEAEGNWQLFQEIKENNIPLESVIFSSDGKFFALADVGNTIGLWRQNAEEKWQLFKELKDEKGINSIALSSDGTLLASGTARGKIRIWRVRNKQLDELFKKGRLSLLMATVLWSYCDTENKESFNWNYFSELFPIISEYPLDIQGLLRVSSLVKEWKEKETIAETVLADEKESD